MGTKLNISLILILAAFLRLYRLPELFVFGFNEEYQANLAMTIVKDFHLIWIGVSAAHLGFYLGPGFTYFTSFWLWLSKGDPLITAYVGATLGVITTFFVFLVGWKMFSIRVGLLSSTLYATLPLLVFFDQKYWNPSPVPLLTILMLYSLFKTPSDPRWWMAVAFIFGIFFHIQLMSLPFIIPIIYFLYLSKDKLNRKVIILSISSFVIVYSPLLVFDYFHNWSNLTTPLRLNQISDAPAAKLNFGYHLQSITAALGRLWYLDPGKPSQDEVLSTCDKLAYAGGTISPSISTLRTSPLAIFSTFSILLLLFFLGYKKTYQQTNTKLLAISILATIFGLMIFPGGIFEYYLLGLFPLFIFLPFILTDQSKILKDLTLGLVIIISALGIYTVMNASSDYGLGTKQELIKSVMAVVGQKPFELVEQGGCHQYEGWRYLFKVYGRTPEKASVDKSLGWIYPLEITNTPPIFKVTIYDNSIPTPTDFWVKTSWKGFSAVISKN